MKKLFYIIVLTIASIATFTSCTEENVTPRSSGNGGANTMTTKGA